MEPKRTTMLTSLSAARRTRASLLMLLYLLALTPVTAELTALIGATDRSHHVTVQQTDTGIQVVLQHDCLSRTMHQHGLVARALTLIAQRPAAGHPDHVIQFAYGIGVQANATILLALERGATLASVLSLHGSFTESSPFHTLRSVPSGLSVGAAPFLLSLRSTVLLI